MCSPFFEQVVCFISASIAVCRSYLSAATKLEERTGAVSMVSLAQVLGFVVGPGEIIQYLFLYLRLEVLDYH
jgi:hypothetical protein